MIARRFLFIIATLALGCSGGADAPKVPVWGRILYRNCPVRGGIVAFTPDAEHGSHGAIGRASLSPDGSFRIADGGLSPGWYRITVASLEVGIPTKFRDPDLANLLREVVTGRENHIDITLDE